MNNREFKIGDRVYCSTLNVVGTVLKFYNSTEGEEQTVVTTWFGKEHYAPTRLWKKVIIGIDEAKYLARLGR